MFSKRQNQYNKLIQKELSIILTKHGREWFSNVMITITMVRISSDLSLAKVYLSVFPFEKAEDTLLEVKKHQNQIRGIFGNIVRNQMRHIPDFKFFIDDTMEFIERLDKVLEK